MAVTSSPLLDVALELCGNLADADRYQRLLAAVRRMVPGADATALLRLEGDALVPIVVDGLVPETLGYRFKLEEHPRLARIMAGDGPVHFRDNTLPDPYDGLVSAGKDVTHRVHACMGCALRIGNDTVGALTVDALDPGAFDDVDDQTLRHFAQLAAGALRTAVLVDASEAQMKRRVAQARALWQEERERRGGEVLGQHPRMQQLKDEVRELARSELTVLIVGETGAGKEVVARSIHAQSSRRDEPLIYVNCAALPDSLAESELFGHKKGSFTGATEDRPGKFEIADGGTLFLDEVGELTLAIQAKLLRALQSGEVQRVGADRPTLVNARIVAATNRDLLAEVKAGRFRADLYHRLSVYPLAVPPLRERKDDIPILAGHFIEAARLRLGLPQVRLTPEAREVLLAYEWPGNVRELEHLMLRAALRASRALREGIVVIAPEHLGLATPTLPTANDTPIGDVISFNDAVDEYRRALIRRTVEQCQGNWAEAARRLSLDRGNLHRLAKRLSLL